MQIVIRKFKDSFELFVQGEKIYVAGIDQLESVVGFLAEYDYAFVFIDMPDFDVSDW